MNVFAISAISSSSVSWLAWELFISLVAASGGIVVFVGLWMEHKAAKEEYADTADLRSSKLRAKRGWKTLMWGIAIEIAVAVGFAVKDGWEIKQIKSDISRNDPRNQPIRTMVATGWFVVRGTNISNLNPANYSSVNLSFGASQETRSNLWKAILPCKSCETYWGNDDSIWALEFGPNLMAPLWNLTATDLVRTADEWDMVVLDAPFVHRGMEISSGEVTLFINGFIMKKFAMPPQKASDPFIGNPTAMNGTTSNRVPVRVMGSL